jgi:hypothetical protein
MGEPAYSPPHAWPICPIIQALILLTAGKREFGSFNGKLVAAACSVPPLSPMRGAPSVGRHSSSQPMDRPTPKEHHPPPTRPAISTNLAATRSSNERNFHPRRRASNQAELPLPHAHLSAATRSDRPIPSPAMASRGVSVLKFVGTVSLGLLTVSVSSRSPLPPRKASPGR